jgi:hypothetical protein
MDRCTEEWDSRDVRTVDKSSWAGAAQAIVQAGLWCAVEVWGDTAATRWEPRLIICREHIDDIARAIAVAISDAPDYDARIAGYTRDSWLRVDAAPTALCHLGRPLAAVA